MFSLNYKNIFSQKLKVVKKKIEIIQGIKIIRTSRRSKSISLKIRNGELEVSCPYNTSEIFIKNLIERKKVWINKNIDRSRKNQKKIDQISNGFITYKGLVLKLVYEKSNLEGIAVEDNELKIFYSDKSKSKKLIIEWLKLQANNFLRARLSFLSKRISIEFNSLTIKSYTARWGSCNIKGDIFLNWKLIMLPESVIDYVLIHELAHINVPNHSREFWKLVKKKDPNYCKNKRWLKDNGSSFILFS
mgnify:FL=1